MAQDTTVTVYNNTTTSITDPIQSHYSFNLALSQSLCGGAILHVTNLAQAKIAEEAGACAVAVLDQIPAGKLIISRMSDPSLIKSIKNSLSIPVISAARIGHFVEAQILQAIGVDYIDETEILTPADDQNHINKHNFQIPFISGARSLGEALHRIREGAIMIRLQGELTNSGNISETVKSVRCLMKELRVLYNMDDDEVFAFAKRIQAPYDLLAQTKQMKRLPVLHFAAGGIVTPADAALMMQLGCNGVFVGSEIFDYEDAFNRVKGIVQAVKNYNDPHVLVETMMMGVKLGDNRIEDGSFDTENV
ncbi:pyridoxal 5'-phosphate synthase-like subunit PDX1.2 [Vicia villosa]|uniref:pyridoxal 5'-phosphate synthase-like subunit PDX1.2 n=1 Tax=Vicia villosa TaxID=3911 RepID=UPI00273B06CD|nr:pyridoxal 5'-phosphate synthase-like subunit PDX1.2 [Vicia villosa]